jgi:hypothetical protein
MDKKWKNTKLPCFAVLSKYQYSRVRFWHNLQSGTDKETGTAEYETRVLTAERQHSIVSEPGWMTEKSWLDFRRGQEFNLFPKCLGRLWDSHSLL